MSELFNALLDMSKLDAGVLAPTLSEFPIDQLLKRIEMTFTAAREKDLRLHVVLSGARIRSDRDSPILAHNFTKQRFKVYRPV
jgi:signal transduction histidine kinase